MLHTTTVLIVDDEVGIRELLSEILAEECYSVLTAANGVEAIKLCNEHSIDVILLDIVMPEMDGIKFLKRMKQSSPSGSFDIPTIIMSGHATIDIAVQATKLGARDVIEKPITMGKLLSKIKHCLVNGKNLHVDVQLRHLDLGQTPAMTKLKESLVQAASTNSPTLILGGIRDGIAFFSHFLIPKKKAGRIVGHRKIMEKNAEDILGDLEDGVLVVRFLNTMNLVQQNGLIALSQLAAQREVQLVVESTQEVPSLSNNADSRARLEEIFTDKIIKLPKLAEFTDDIPALAPKIIEYFSTKLWFVPTHISGGAINLLMNHAYEEDFAELMMIIQSSMQLAHDEEITEEVIATVIEERATQLAQPQIEADLFPMPLRQAREKFETLYFQRLIDHTNGDISRTAAISGLERTSLYRKFKQLNIGVGQTK